MTMCLADGCSLNVLDSSIDVYTVSFKEKLFIDGRRKVSLAQKVFLSGNRSMAVESTSKV